MFKHNKAVWGWALYDWGNSAFATTVMAGFFPIFFKQYWSTGADVNLSTAQLGLANSLASLLVAMTAPVLGAIADRGSYKKKFLTFFAYLGVLMTSCLFMVEQGDWLMAVFVYTLGTIGFSGANVFYDSLLPSLANEESVDSVSSLGFAMGYLGGYIARPIAWPARRPVDDAFANLSLVFANHRRDPLASRRVGRSVVGNPSYRIGSTSCRSDGDGQRRKARRRLAGR